MTDFDRERLVERYRPIDRKVLESLAERELTATAAGGNRPGLLDETELFAFADTVWSGQAAGERGAYKENDDGNA
ncbi:MAG: hypothetical protein ING90_02135 [Rhodocyclaceae bacterium]|nr:hypothetical protein [Rhodocyclaceae bacterium]